MMNDKNNKFYNMSSSQISEGVKIALQNSLHLLDIIENIKDDEKFLPHGLGLHTFAIEEFGKALLLEEYLKKENTDVLKEIFYEHKIKFQKALEFLPSECTTVYGEICSFTNSTGESKTFTRTDNGEEVRFALGTSGTLSIIDFMTTDFQIRKDCFYLDWDAKNQQWSKSPLIDSKELDNATANFKKVLIKKISDYSDDT